MWGEWSWANETFSFTKKLRFVFELQTGRRVTFSSYVLLLSRVTFSPCRLHFSHILCVTALNVVMASSRPSRKRCQPRWAAEYELASGHLEEDQWAVKRLLDCREASKGKAKQYLVEWEGEFSPSWVPSRDVSRHLKEEFARNAAKEDESTVAKAEGFDDEPGPSGIGRHQREDDNGEDGHSDAESVAASEPATAPVAEEETASEPAITTLEKRVTASGQPTATGQSATGVVHLQADRTGLAAVDISTFSESVRFQLLSVWSFFFSLIEFKKRRKGEGIDYRTSFDVPCLFDTFVCCFVRPFVSSSSTVCSTQSYRIALTVNQLDKIFHQINVEKGCLWYYRDSRTSDSCKIYGKIYLTWFNGSTSTFDHSACRRCNASEEELTSVEDTGGLDNCDAVRVDLTLGPMLRVSFKKFSTKSRAWQATPKLEL